MPKPGQRTINHLPKQREVVKFLANLKANKWDLHRTLASESQQRPGAQWCQLCTLYVAIYAVLTGQEQAFATVNSTKQGNHIMGTLYGEVVDYAKDQYTEQGYTSLTNEPQITPTNRKFMLRSAKDFAKDARPHKAASTIRALLLAGKEDMAQELGKLLPQL